jgi:uncharacterized protein
VSIPKQAHDVEGGRMNETTTARVVWFEVPAKDTEQALAFYGGLFGWQFERFGDADYHTTSAGGGAIAGGAKEQGVLTYFGVGDVDAAVERVRDLGGGSGAPEEIPGVGRYAHCTDPDGNRFGLFQPAADS